MQGGHRARLASTVHRRSPGLPRPAHRDDRHRAQHDRGEHAHRGPARAVAVAHAGAAERELRAELERSKELGAPAANADEELEDKARLLAEQNAEVERKNREVEQARAALEEKAEQLALTSKYKSEFLANMSHELRTPLNSLLILVQLLADNSDGNLTEQAGRVRQDDPRRRATTCSRSSTTSSTSRRSSRARWRRRRRRCRSPSSATTSSGRFRHVADEKGLEFSVEIEPPLPATIADRRQAPPAGAQEPALQRLQVHRARARSRLRAIRAAVGLERATTRPRRGRRGRRLRRQRHRHRHPARQAADHLRGVPAGRRHHQPQVRRHRPRPLHQPRDRAAARRRDPACERARARAAPSPSTCRSPAPRRRRHHSAAAGRSPPPRHRDPPAAATAAGRRPRRWRRRRWPRERRRPRPGSRECPLGAASAEVQDDRYAVRPGDRMVLIVEDDPAFARVLLDMANQRRLKAVVALHGEEAVALAREFRPDAITLDIHLEDLSGWTVLDWLQHNPDTRHIPVHIVSIDDDSVRAQRSGASSALIKPAAKDALDHSSTRSTSPSTGAPSACSSSRTTRPSASASSTSAPARTSRSPARRPAPRRSPPSAGSASTA